MAESDKIADLDQLEAWLETQDPRFSRTIATRASLRSLPALMVASDHSAEKRADTGSLLIGLRATLISGVASVCETPDIKRVEVAAFSARTAGLSATRSAAHATARFAALSATLSTAISTLSAAEFAGSAALSAADTVGSAALANAFSDGESAKTSAPHQIFTENLWSNPHDADRSLAMWEEFATSQDSENLWAFWREWYSGMLTGKPIDWNLQLRVALIDDAIWEAGPEPVAKEIERIRAKFELEQEVAALKEQLNAQQQIIARTPQIGDNGGPPLDGPNAQAFKNDLVLIWSDIEELDAELAKPEPSPPVLKRIAQSLFEVALRIAAYFSTTVDAIVKEGAKTIGKGAGGLIVAEYIKPGTVEAVAKAIGKYFSALAN